MTGVRADAVEQHVIEVVTSIVGARAVDPKADWRSLGMDSLDLLSLIIAVEERFGVAIADLIAMSLRNVSDVVTFLGYRFEPRPTKPITSR